MKDILLLVHDDSGQEARFQAALDVGRAVEGHLTCLDVTIMPTTFAPGYAGDNGLAILLTEERQRESANRTRLESRLGVEDVPWSWLGATGALAPCLKDASVLADLIVVNRQLDAFPLPDMRAAASELIVHARCPVLAVPDELERLDLDGAMIAWDGSFASAAALRAAVPLLRHTEWVVIVEIDDGSIDIRAEAAAIYLSRHGIHSTIRRLPAGTAKAGDIVLEQAGRDEFGYVVMGGFGRSRFAEAVFGGVTRAMLAKSPLPLLMAH